MSAVLSVGVLDESGVGNTFVLIAVFVINMIGRLLIAYCCLCHR